MQTEQRDVLAARSPASERILPPVDGKPGFWHVFSQHRVASIVIAHISVLAMVTVLLFGSGLGTQLLSALAQSPCSRGDTAYVVVRGDTLGAIAARHHTSWQRLASYNHIANPNVIYVHQTVCISGSGHTVSKPVTRSGPALRGRGNYFPYGQCTWWAAQRFYQLHHVYVPWTTQANAWQWAVRARDFHWHVSSRPSVGAIIVLQPWVQGAYGLGHVAIVERVLRNGHVIASNMNWGARYWQVVDVQFSPGYGVTFISF